MEIKYAFENNNLYRNFTLKYGQYPLLQIWKSLGLETEFKEIQKEIDAQYSLNNAAFLITFMRALYPKADFGELTDKNKVFVGGTQGNIELADLIDCFRKLIPFKDRLLTTINNKLNGEFGDQRTKTIFYDIVPTNLYMVPRDMLEKIRVHNLEELSKEMKELAKKCHEAGTLPDQSQILD